MHKLINKDDVKDTGQPVKYKLSSHPLNLLLDSDSSRQERGHTIRKNSLTYTTVQNIL